MHPLHVQFTVPITPGTNMQQLQQMLDLAAEISAANGANGANGIASSNGQLAQTPATIQDTPPLALDTGGQAEQVEPTLAAPTTVAHTATAPAGMSDTPKRRGRQKLDKTLAKEAAEGDAEAAAELARRQVAAAIVDQHIANVTAGKATRGRPAAQPAAAAAPAPQNPAMPPPTPEPSFAEHEQTLANGVSFTALTERHDKAVQEIGLPAVMRIMTATTWPDEKTPKTRWWKLDMVPAAAYDRLYNELGAQLPTHAG